MYQRQDSVAKISTELELPRLMSGNLSKGRLSVESALPSAAKTRLRAFRAKARDVLKQNNGRLVFSIRQSEFLSDDGIGGSKLDGLILVDDSEFPLNPQESRLRYCERSGKDFDRENGYLVRKLHSKSPLPYFTSLSMLIDTLKQDVRWMQALIQMESASGRPPVKTGQIFFLVLNESGTDYNVVNVTDVLIPPVSSAVAESKKQAVNKPTMQEEKQRKKRKVEMKPELKTDVKHVSGGSLSFDEWYLLASGLLSVLTPRLSEAGKDLTVQPFDRSVSEFVELCGQYDRAIKVRLDKLEDAKETLSKIPQGDAYKMERQHAATYCETVNNSAQKSITKRNALIDSVVALPPREFIRFTKTLQTKMIDERIAEKGQVDYVGEVLPQSKKKDIAEKANDELAAAIEERREFDAVLDEALELYDFSEECSPEYKKPMPKNHNIAAETVKALSSFRVSTSSSSLFSKPAPVKDGSFVAQAVRFAIRLGF